MIAGSAKKVEGMEGKRSKEEEVEFFFFSGEKNEGENSKLSFNRPSSLFFFFVEGVAVSPSL